jgi:hypothetical protein
MTMTIFIKVLVSRNASFIFHIDLLQFIVPLLLIQELYTLVSICMIPLSILTGGITKGILTEGFSATIACSMGFSNTVGVNTIDPVAIAAVVVVVMAPVWIAPVVVVGVGTITGDTSSD